MLTTTMNLEIRKATVKDIPIIQQLSESIWKKHYIAIISMEQITYMLQKMYATEKLLEELNDPTYEYFIALLNGSPCGYISISKESSQNYLLHKFYVTHENCFQGMGEKIFKHVFTEKPYQQIQLFVNRQNFKSVNFYFKMGFKISNVVDNHFGEGYYMNDFIMVKKNEAINSVSR